MGIADNFSREIIPVQSSSRLESLNQERIKLEKLHAKGELEDVSELAECCTKLAFEYGACMKDALDSDESQTMFQKAIALWEIPYVADTPEARKRLINCYENRGRYFFGLHKYKDALVFCQKALNVLEHTNFGLLSFDTRQLYQDYADTLLSLGRYNEYLDVMQKLRKVSLSMTQRSGHPKSTISAANTLAHYGYVKEAIIAYEAEIRHMESTKDSYWNRSHEECLCGYADMLYDLGHYDEALEQYEKAIAICTREYQKTTLAHTDLKCAYTLNKLDRNKEALLMCQESISLYENLTHSHGAHYQQAVAYAFYSNLLTILNQHEAADQALKNALTLLDLLNGNEREKAIEEIARRNIQKTNGSTAVRLQSDTVERPEDKAFSLYTCSKYLDELNCLEEAATVLADAVAILEQTYYADEKKEATLAEKLKSSCILYYEILQELGKKDESSDVQKQVIAILSSSDSH